MKLLLSLLSFLFIAPALAAGESNSVFQIVTFLWNEEGQKLEFAGTGSGTSINTGDGSRQGPESQGIITNKHVIEYSGRVVDFVLLCPAQENTKSFQRIVCNVPAQVTALHPDSDVAIIKPLNENFFLIPVPVVNYQNRYNDPIRLQGFPSVLENKENLGSNKIFEAFLRWNKEGGPLEAEGSKLTITRGNIDGMFVQEKNLENIYYRTDAIGNFGLSGGAAFDKNGKYIGIPTLIDQNNNTYVLSYLSFRDWLNKNISLRPQVKPEVLDFYENTTQKTKNTKPVLPKKEENLRPISSFVPEKPKASLSDIDLSTREGKAAQYLHENKIISGRPDGTFDGNAEVNRAEMAKFLMEALNANIKEIQEVPFSDVPTDAWYRSYVAQAYSRGIINGYDNGEYRPSQTINTAEFLKMISVAFALPQDNAYAYEDVKTDDWFSIYAGNAFRYGLFPSRIDGNLEPARNMTRNEVAYALWRLLTQEN